MVLWDEGGGLVRVGGLDLQARGKRPVSAEQVKAIVASPAGRALVDSGRLRLLGGAEWPPAPKPPRKATKRTRTKRATSDEADE